MAEPSNSGPMRRNGGIQLSRIIDSLDNTIPLPQDLRSFAVYCAVLTVVASGMLIHVLLSAQILQTEVKLADMQDHYTVLKRQNGELLWRIGRATNFQHVQDKARSEGYHPITERQFVEVDLTGKTAKPLSVSVPEQEAPSTAGHATADDANASVAADSEGDAGVETNVEGPEAARLADIEADSAPVDRMQLLRQWRGVLFVREVNGEQPAIDNGANESDLPSEESGFAERDSDVSQPAWLSELVENVEVLFARTAER